jgi:hypothetical protein
MSSHKCAEHIPHYSPDEVFDVATLVDTLPDGQRFALEIDADRFAEGVLARLRFVAGGRDHRIDGKVTECILAERVKIEGSSHVGEAAVWFDLSPDEELGGTKIGYGFSINHCWRYKPAEPLVAQYLKGTMSHYADLYKQNIVGGLGARATMLPTKKPPRVRN